MNSATADTTCEKTKHKRVFPESLATPEIEHLVLVLRLTAQTRRSCVDLLAVDFY